jgi:hypothetical protein
VPRALLLIAIAITFLVLLRRVQQLPPHKRRGGYIQLTLGVALVATVLLTLLGKMHWIGAAVTGLFVLVRQLLPILVRGFPLLQRWFQQRSTGASGAHSEVKTALLKMTLDHESGDLDGEILVGTFKEWRLSELGKDQLMELMEYSREHDPDSAQLLSNYLDQRFPGGWDGAEADASENQQSSAMTTKEALAVLGLADGASEEEIVAAHRKLMQKMHPDRGGNDYLAAKINEAKDFLLKG